MYRGADRDGRARGRDGYARARSGRSVRVLAVMVLPLLVAGGYGAAALASAAGAARLRRQLAKMAAGPRGDPLSADVPLRSTEREVARLGRTLVISDELQVRESGDTLHTLFDYVLLSSERIVLHNAHSTDKEFHEADAEMSVEVRIPASASHAHWLV